MKARFGSLIKKPKIGIGVFPSILLTDNFLPQMLPYQLWAFVDMYIVYMFVFVFVIVFVDGQHVVTNVALVK